MGQLDNLPGNDSPQPQQSAEQVLRVLSQDLESLRHKLSSQLSQDIVRLEAHKERLMTDIEVLEAEFESLKVQHQQLKHDHALALNDQQQAQQQLWAKRLAQALATQLHARLSASLTATSTGIPDGQNGLTSLEAANQRLVSLDTTIHSTLQTLQQDLNSYHSTLSQQISRMHSMEQQGEAILEALINRLSQQLQQQMVQPTISNLATPYRNGHSSLPNGYPASPISAVLSNYAVNGQSTSPNPNYPQSQYPSSTAVSVSHQDSMGVGTTQLPNFPSPHPGPAATAVVDTGRPTAQSGCATQHNNLQRGLLFVGLSTLALSIHNVLVGIIGYGGNIFGYFPVDGIFSLNIPNSLMLLWLRMVVVLPLMFLLAGQLYPAVWRDMRQLVYSRDKRPIYQIIASGSFLFLSQVLIYKAISDVGPGVAVTLLFMYPLLTVPLAWFLFNDRPTPLRLVVMFAITMGIVFTALPSIYKDLSGSVSFWGVGAAILSSAAFALFLVSMQLSFRRVHPVPVSLLQFCTIFALASLILILGAPFGLRPGAPSSQLGLYIGGLLLGLLTLLGYLFNNYGVKLMGAAQASIVASSGPVITAILAYVITPGEKSALQFIQWMGVIFVTLGVISLSLERWANQQRSTKANQQRVVSS
jgi:drug/metabolite transporter (DMT)-like permease